MFSVSSPQQIVDCSYTDGNMGCDGGSLRAALRYVTREGLTSELHYPYIGKVGRVVLDIMLSIPNDHYIFTLEVSPGGIYLLFIYLLRFNQSCTFQALWLGLSSTHLRY